MNVEEVRDYCLAKEGVTEGFPFGEEVLVFKVMEKIFLLTSLDANPFRINLKMNPELAEEYREKYEDVMPGYHMNKRHWNTVVLDGSIPRGEIERMIDRSFGLVVKSLKKAERQALEIRHGKDALYR